MINDKKTNSDRAVDLSTISRSSRFRRWRMWLFGLVLISVGIPGFLHRPLLVWSAGLFRVDDPAPSDALVVLNGQWLVRPVHAATLYQKGIAPVVLMGETKPIPYPELCESALNKRVLLRAGVPTDAIHVLPGEIESTQEEAMRVRDYLKIHPARRITVVTNAFHTFRARTVFRKVLQGMGVDVRMAAAPDPRFDESNWYQKEIGRGAYLAEAVKVIYYWLRY